MNLRNVAVIVAAGLVTQLAACSVVKAWHGDESPTPSATQTPHSGGHSRPPLPSKSTALGAAMRLKVWDGVWPSGRYERSLFGAAWADTDHNGCDTRNDILRRDLRKRHTKPWTGGCVLARGILVSPYSGDRVEWVKGQTTIQIDHVVSLHDAFKNGMHDATPAEREAFANDPLNLDAVDSDENRRKADKTIVQYAPIWDAKARCEFAVRQVSVKTKYHLTVTDGEKQAFLTVLGGSNYCAGDKLKLLKSSSGGVKVSAPRPIGE